MLTLIGLLALAYLVGSIPTGYMIVRAGCGVDVREYGSHNVGAINVARVGGVRLGLVTLAVDVGKAVLVVLLARALDAPDSAVAAAALLVMIGHAYSAWFYLREGRMSEGKSVASGLGVLAGLAMTGIVPMWVPVAPVALWACGLLVPRLLTGRWPCISIATMLATVSVPVAVGAAGPPVAYSILSLMMAALILIRHRNNVLRLRGGVEPRANGVFGSARPERPAILQGARRMAS